MRTHTHAQNSSSSSSSGNNHKKSRKCQWLHSRFYFCYCSDVCVRKFFGDRCGIFVNINSMVQMIWVIWNETTAEEQITIFLLLSLVRSIFVRHLHSFNVKSHEICGPCFWFLLFGNLTFERCVSDATFFSFFSLGVLSWSLSLSFLRLFVHNLLIHWFFDVLKSIEMKSFSFLFFVFCLRLVALPRSADFKLCHRGANSI